MRFHDRLGNLGFESYTAYLAGDHWREFKRQYRLAGHPAACSVCGERPVQLHHQTYVRLGREEFGDVRPLCREHHVAVHDWLKARRLPVERTRSAIRALRGEVVPKEKKKRRPDPAATGLANLRASMLAAQTWRDRAVKEFRDLIAAGCKCPGSDDLDPVLCKAKRLRVILSKLRSCWQRPKPPAVIKLEAYRAEPDPVRDIVSSVLYGRGKTVKAPVKPWDVPTVKKAVGQKRKRGRRR